MLVSRVLIAAMTLLAAGEVGAQQCVIPPPGLVAWWPADGNVTDIVGGNSPTQTLGQPYFVSARVGQGFKFDGEAGFIVPDSPSLNFTANASFTLDAWVRIDGEGKDSFHHDNLVDKRANAPTPGGQRGYSMGVTHPTHHEGQPEGPVIGFGISEDNARDLVVGVRSNPIGYGELHFVAGVVDRARQTIALYLDGVLQQEATIVNIGDLSNSARLFLGHHSLDLFTFVRPFNGVLDEIEIFHRALTASEIQAIFNAGGAGKCRRIIRIDIKPGSDPNCFNANGKGVIPVAILGSADFDVTMINPRTVRLDDLAVRERPNGLQCALENSNGDGFSDLVCHFEEIAGKWTRGSTIATLTGSLFEGTTFGGTDSICIVK